MKRTKSKLKLRRAKLRRGIRNGTWPKIGENPALDWAMFDDLNRVDPQAMRAMYGLIWKGKP